MHELRLTSAETTISSHWPVDTGTDARASAPHFSSPIQTSPPPALRRIDARSVYQPFLRPVSFWVVSTA